MARRALYIETLIRADHPTLWRRTQDPDQHQRWDLRFTRIEYLRPAGDGGPRRFRYATRVLPGLTVAGVGVSAGERTGPDGSGTSALRFDSRHPLSPVRSGSGYWRYLPTPNGIRFVTGYDYEPGWGPLGRLTDRAFRPLMGWATAWSFDRLRLWLERGVPPEAARWWGLADAGARAAAVLVTLRGGHPVAAGAVLLLAWLVPAAPWVPSARRCRRRPPDRAAATAPRILSALERP